MTGIEWTKSKDARMVLGHSLDPRPAWLWDRNGENLVWRNVAAVVFRGAARKNGLKPFKLPVPIKGQVKRLIRLGSHRRSSLSRIRFLAGKKPLALTSACTPLTIGGEPMLLICALEPVEPALLKGRVWREGLATNMFSDPLAYVLSDPAGNLLGVPLETATGYKRKALKKLARQASAPGTNADHEGIVVLKPAGARLIFPNMLVLADEEAPDEPAPTLKKARPEADKPEAANAPSTDTSKPSTGPPTDKPERVGLGALVDRLAARPALFEPIDTPDPTPFGPVASAARPPTPAPEPGPPPSEPGARYIYAVNERGVVASDGYRVLDAEILEELQARLDERALEAVEFVLEGEDVQAVASFDRNGRATGWRLFGPSRADEEKPDPKPVPNPDNREEQFWVVRGQGLGKGNDEPPAGGTDGHDPDRTPPLRESVAAIERQTAELEKRGGKSAKTAKSTKSTKSTKTDLASRYNFDELSRLLSERIGDEIQPGEAEPGKTTPGGTGSAGALAKENDIDRPSAPPADKLRAPGSLVTLSDETLVLNRLSLGLLIFRDQSLLFANRAIAELAGYSSSSALRAAGFANLFPSAGSGNGSVGPVTELIGRNGQVVPVLARLQSIVWQGRPALLLSAQRAGGQAVDPDRTTGQTAHQAAATLDPADLETERLEPAALELIGAQTGDGFVYLSVNGTIERVSERAEHLLGPVAGTLSGRPLLGYLDAEGRKTLAGFMLEGPASQAITVRASSGPAPVDITLVSLRNIRGEISGYCGLIRAAAGPAPVARPADDDRSLGPVLAQLSRELRAPLNTVLGFSELVGEARPGELAPSRIAEYARDIHRAGGEINTLLAELSDLSRLADSQFKLDTSEVDLGFLLEGCAVRIRPSANRQRVVVRSAVPEKLPRIVADRDVLIQTIMNLLASAISLAKPGGQVVLSAQVARNGAIGINVRDSGAPGPFDPADGFVIFREPDGTPEWARAPLRSRIGLAVTQSLARANAFSLTLDPLGAAGTLMSLEIPARKTVSG
jgi:signal transduction histidine kinase/PAS domain-containing protein